MPRVERLVPFVAWLRAVDGFTNAVTGPKDPARGINDSMRDARHIVVCTRSDVTPAGREKGRDLGGDEEEKRSGSRSRAGPDELRQ